MANAEVNEKNNIFKLFKFVADNSNVEWSVAKIDFEGKHIYNIATYHYDELSPGNSGVDGGTLIGMLHSHVDMQTYKKPNGSIDWSKSELKSMKYDGGIVNDKKIIYPYIIYFQQTKNIYRLKYNINSSSIESSYPKSFKF